jgi:hypothetical protein
VLGTATLAGASTGALTGCDDLATPARGGSLPADPDTVVVDQAVVALRAALEQVRRTTRRHPGLRAELAPVLALHTAHLDALRDAATTPFSSPTAAAAPPPAQHPAAALAGVATSEKGLHARLAGLAQQARSGELARLLGAMAAGTSQRLAAWPA